MNTPETLQDLTIEGAVLPPMAFRLPDGMHAIEVSLDADERAQAAQQLVREIYPRGEVPLWETMGSLYSAMADQMLASGVGFFGIGLYGLEDDRGVAHCSLTIAAFESGETDQEVVAQGIKALLLRDTLREVTWLDLPCGPAVCAVSFQKLVVDGGYTKSGQDEELIMGQIQVHIPFATGPYTAVFTLDTASVEQWDEFAHAVAGIVGSVEFPPSTAPAGLLD
ncbi:hypothetical protein [Streptomyces arenae]|uniref:hypothetical protein n=1 Tax=Streptomyces arenae TaxID=29301 RepID=UPI00265A3198|nr:hypothetical protein [Streptomyces arenae]MCG7202935.1 hypothetical protein [Streptomyces arenae]